MNKEREFISCEDYVALQGKIGVRAGRMYNTRQVEILFKIYNYARLLKQEPKLGDFIACDKEGNILKEPLAWDIYLSYRVDSLSANDCVSEIKEYQEAEDRVLFEGFTEAGSGILFHAETGFYIDVDKYKTLSELTGQGLTLTKNALK